MVEIVIPEVIVTIIGVIWIIGKIINICDHLNKVRRK